MSSRIKEKQVGQKPIQKKKRMNEALLFVIIIAVILGGMLAYIFIKERADRDPSSIDGVSMGAYNLGTQMIDLINSEIIITLDESGEATDEEDPNTVLTTEFYTYYSEISALTEAQLQSRGSSNEITYFQVINLAVETQLTEATLKDLELQAEVASSDILALGLDDISQLSDVINIYDSIWRQVIDIAASENIEQMENLISTGAEEISAPLEPYSEFITNLNAAIEEANSTTSDTDVLTNTDGNITLGEE